ncbi:hypothetical protein [Paenibacillus oenotherae]|uniref:hypothetical protein n=1 Tax=Paenibacillus oenotherae TaxID=1435645 RepID=UPI001FEBFA85
MTNQSLSLNGQSNNYSYSYDPLNRIATSSQFNGTYAYNNRGNRLSLQSDKAREIPAGETNYTYDA